MANQVDVTALFNQGRMFYEGQGISKNYKFAVQWYKLVAEQGDADAQSNLIAMYGGVIQDYVYSHI